MVMLSWTGLNETDEAEHSTVGGPAQTNHTTKLLQSLKLCILLEFLAHVSGYVLPFANHSFDVHLGSVARNTFRIASAG